MTTGDLVRLQPNHVRAGQTGCVQRVGVSEVEIRLTSTGQSITVRRDQVRRIAGEAVTVTTTRARERLAS